MSRSARLAKLAAKPSSATIRPLGTPAKKVSSRTKKGVDTPLTLVVSSDSAVGADSSETTTQAAPAAEQAASAAEQDKTMALTLKGLSKNGKQAFYSGAAQVIRIAVGAFPGKTAPQTIPVPDGVFEGPRQPKAKMTAEERKALRAAKPKPTLAERIAKREAQLAKDKAKLAAGADATM